MKPQDALEACLHQIEAGAETVGGCSAAYPGLEAALRTAGALRACVPAPSPDAQRRIWARVQQAAQAQAVRRRPAGPARWISIAAAALAMLVIVAGIVTDTPASLPGEPLYSVKRALEAAELFAASPAGRAELYASLARRRLDETAELEAAGRLTPDRLATLSAELGYYARAAIEASAGLPASTRSGLLADLLEVIEAQEDRLARTPPVTGIQTQTTLELLEEQAALAGARLGRSASPTEPAPANLAVTEPATALAPRPTSVSSPTLSASPTAAEPTGTPGAPPSTHMPPGQLNRTEPASGTSNQGGPPHGQGNGASPNCNANSPNSPNYCTPTAAPTDVPDSSSITPTPGATEPPPPTPCPTNPGGQPKCRP